MKKILFLLFISPSVSLGWGELGHSTVGYIAEQKLTAKAKGLVYLISGTEPLAVSGPWPDYVRSDDRYKPFGPYHYLTVPYEFTYQNLPAALKAAKDSDTMISQAPELLIGGKLKRDQKVLLLRYLVHIVGDVHQPLHVGNGIDMGGNLCDVNFLHPETKRWITINLHAAWDDYILKNVSYEYLNRPGPMPTSKRWFGYREFGDMLLKDSTLGINYQSVTATATRYDWYEESRKLHPEVYPDETPLSRAEDRPYCKTYDSKTGQTIEGRYDAGKLPKLNQAYIDKSIITMKKRILTAGYRLAHLLNSIAEKSGAPEWTPQADRDIFDAVLIKNEDLVKGSSLNNLHPNCD